MAKGKWYVVTVGTDIGIFSRWLDAGPLVKGIPEAMFESYTTFEEANMVFAREQALGRTRIIGRNNGHNTTPAQSNAGSSYNDASQKVSLANNECHCCRNCERGSAQTSSLTVGASASPPYGKTQSAIFRSSSEPSAALRRFQVIDALFNNEFVTVKVQARVSKLEDTLALTPTSDARSYSPSKSSAVTARAVVQTPAWVPQYPRSTLQSSDVLSPLNNANLALKSFQDPISGFQVDYRSLNMPGSSLYLSPASTIFDASRTDKHAVTMDPRSPLNPRVNVQDSLSKRVQCFTSF